MRLQFGEGGDVPPLLDGFGVTKKGEGVPLWL